MIKKLIIVLMLLSISGCGGFKLRGSYTIPQYLKIVYISPNEPFEPFQRALRSRLVKLNVVVVCDTSKNVTLLHLGTPTVSQQALAYGPSGQLQRYSLIYSVNYTLTTNDFTRSGTITRRRELSQSPNLMLSNESEEQTVKNELIDEAVNELLRQITSRPSSNCANTSSSDNDPC